MTLNRATTYDLQLVTGIIGNTAALEPSIIIVNYGVILRVICHNHKNFQEINIKKALEFVIA